MSQTKLLDQFDTIYSADSVEYNPLISNFLVCGTYQLIEDLKGNQKVGRLFVFDTSNEKLEELQRIESEAILDLKWCPSKNYLLSATVDGSLDLYYLKEEQTLEKIQTNSTDAINLSIDWNNRISKEKNTEENICAVISHSNGKLSTWNLQNEGLIEVSNWKAHDYEAWISAFNYWDTNLVFSGSDDCSLKYWDLRTDCSYPNFKINYDMGVTTIQSSPYEQHLFAVGSYNETLKIWDTRSVKKPVSEYQGKGGIWRVKWHPSNPESILVACMHGGFEVLNISENHEIESKHHITNPHGPAKLGYGVDWCYKNQKEATDSNIIACCSFYDHLLTLWKGTEFLKRKFPKDMNRLTSNIYAQNIKLFLNSTQTFKSYSNFQQIVKPNAIKPFNNFLKNQTQKKQYCKKEEPKPEGDPNPGLPWNKIILAAFVVPLSLAILTSSADSTTSRSILSFSEFQELVIAGQVTTITVRKVKDFANVDVTLKDGVVKKMYASEAGSLENQLTKWQQILDTPTEKLINVKYPEEHKVAGRVLGTLLTTALYVAPLLYLMSRGPMSGGSGGISSLLKGNSPAKLLQSSTQKTTFKDVAGLPEAKQEITEFVDFLKNPKRYEALGAKIPRGALLVGPPGTGKTLLAKAVAGEAEVPFFSVSGSDFVEMYGGLGASRVRTMFEEARKKQPCIIFIDEIDAIGRSRKNTFQNDERANTLNALLVELDGFNTTATNIVVLAGTNREDVLDEALLRAGRFDRKITLSNPDIFSRKAIFGVHFEKYKVAGNDDPEKLKEVIAKLSARTPGFSGADIANCCNLAALQAASDDKDAVELTDFEKAIDIVIGGIERKSKIILPDEKKRIAWHEAGHAIAAWFLEHTPPLLRISIVPRGVKTLGFTQYHTTDKFLVREEEIFDTMAMKLGGRIAEYLAFKDYSTNGADDLGTVTEMAYGNIQKYGFNKEVGAISYHTNNEGIRDYSEETAEIMDQQVKSVVDEQFERAKKILVDHFSQLEKLAELLFEKETVTREQVENILGPRPFEEHDVNLTEADYARN